jgi:very-short-patch-repair endonuclease
VDAFEVFIGRQRKRGWRQVAHGVHRKVFEAPPHDSTESSDDGWRLARDEHMADLRAWQQILPPTASFTHLTAAGAVGLWLPPTPANLPVTVSMPKAEERPRRGGLSVSRLTVPFEPIFVEGLRVAPMPEVLLACARDLGLLDLVLIIDSALRHGCCTRDELADVAGPRRRGAPALRAALPYADPRAESPWETLLRMFHVLCQVPVDPQFEVYDGRGAFVARGDLWLRGTRTLHEYDGAVHRDRRTHVNDLARERRLANAGWTRRGYTSADLLQRPQTMLREADAALGRPHDPRRVLPWLTALRESLFTHEGRLRLLDRFGVV